MARKRKKKIKVGWWQCDIRPTFIDGEVLASKAYRSLRTPSCYVVYGVFLLKRVMKNLGTRYEPEWVVVNNGKIEFTYKEARDKWGISNYKFDKAIENLVEVGLIDIAEPSDCRVSTLYAVSDRWNNYGTEDFIEKKVVKRPVQGGFQVGNRLGRHFTAAERQEYRQQLKQQKVDELHSELDELEQSKLAALEDARRNGPSRVPAIIDQVIDRCTTRLRRLQGR